MLLATVDKYLLCHIIAIIAVLAVDALLTVARQALLLHLLSNPSSATKQHDCAVSAKMLTLTFKMKSVMPFRIYFILTLSP